MTDRVGKTSKGWEYNGSKRPPFAIKPKVGQRSVWDFPRPPIIERVPTPIVVRFQSMKIVDTVAALAVLETASPPTYYIPRYDIDMGVLVNLSGKTSWCEWKGTARYWGLKNDEHSFYCMVVSGS